MAGDEVSNVDVFVEGGVTEWLTLKRSETLDIPMHVGIPEDRMSVMIDGQEVTYLLTEDGLSLIMADVSIYMIV